MNRSGIYSKIAVFSVLFRLAGVALADNMGGPGEGSEGGWNKGACKADEDTYCKDVTPGEGREMACLHAHSDKISAGCKDVIKRHHHRMMGGMHEGSGMGSASAPGGTPGSMESPK